MNKKANAALALLVVLLVIILVYGVYNYAKSDCRDNSACAEDEYCGSDFECHKYPVIERNIVTSQNTYDLKGAAVIVGIAIVIAAVILRRARKKRDDQGDFKDLYKQDQETLRSFDVDQNWRQLHKKDNNISENKSDYKRY